MTRPPRLQRDERGSAAPLTMALSVCLILIPVIALVMVLPTWAEKTSDAHDIARNAARSLVTARNWTAGVAAADKTARDIATNNGLDPADIQTVYTGNLTPGSAVTATVTVTIQGVQIPGFGTVGTSRYTTNSTEHVDLYRRPSR